MKDVRKHRSQSSRFGEICRRITGSLLEIGFKAYGTAAAVSVALSDGETFGGKLYDAVAAVPNLTERYRQAKYVLDHREQIQAALEYVHQHAPDVQQVEAAIERSYAALESARRMFSEVDQAKEALTQIDWTDWTTIPNVSLQALDHLGKAWDTMPDLNAVTHLANMAQNVTPVLHYLGSLKIDFTRLYGGVLCFVDNFARDEIVGTLAIMAASIVAAFILGTAAGFWGRRGRPGLLVRLLQGFGAWCFPGWYGRNLELALGRSLYAVACQRIQGDLVADPQGALDPEAYRELEQHFEHRLREKRLAAGA